MLILNDDLVHQLLNSIHELSPDPQPYDGVHNRDGPLVRRIEAARTQAWLRRVNTARNQLISHIQTAYTEGRKARELSKTDGIKVTAIEERLARHLDRDGWIDYDQSVACDSVTRCATNRISSSLKQARDILQVIDGNYHG